MAEARLLQSKKDGTGTEVSLRKHDLALCLFSKGRVRNAQWRKHCQGLHSLRQVKGTEELQNT